MKKSLLIIGLMALPLSALANTAMSNPCVPGSRTCSAPIGQSITVGQNGARADDAIAFSGDVVAGKTYVCQTSALTQGATGNFIAKDFSQAAGHVSGSPLTNQCFYASPLKA